MKIKDLIEKYLLHVRLNFSFGNYKYNKSHLNHFLNYAENVKGISMINEVTYQVMYDYIEHMKKTCINRTINKNVGAVKRMLKHQNIDIDFMQTINKLKERKNTFDILTIAEMKQLRKFIREHDWSTYKNGLMYQGILSLLCDTGARANEVIHIEKENVNLKMHEVLLTTTKTNVDRYVYLAEGLSIPIVKRLLKVKHNHKYLLHNIDKNRPCNYDDVVHTIKIAKKHLPLKKLHAHMIRHSFATNMIVNGCDLPSLQIALGHSNLETTERYLHMSRDHVSAVIKRTLILHSD